MKTFIWNLLRALHDARQRRIAEHALAELDSHTLRDIGLLDGAESARIFLNRNSGRTAWK